MDSNVQPERVKVSQNLPVGDDNRQTDKSDGTQISHLDGSGFLADVVAFQGKSARQLWTRADDEETTTKVQVREKVEGCNHRA